MNFGTVSVTTAAGVTLKSEDGLPIKRLRGWQVFSYGSVV